MKKTTKKWLIAAAVLILVGLLVFAGVLMKLNWDFHALGNVKYESKTFDIGTDFQNISIHTNTDDIAFALSDDGTCKVVCREREKVTHTAAVRDNTLAIGLVDTRAWYDRILDFSFDSSPNLTVFLPQAEYSALRIEESTGNVKIPEDFRFDSVDISASTGNVECAASALGSVRIELTTGDVSIFNTSAKDIIVSVSTGKVRLDSVTCSGSVSVEVSTGKTKLIDVACRSVISDGSTGDITLEDVGAVESITIERSTGDVLLSMCDAAELYIKTDTGDVTGSLLTEKVFITQSDTGRIDVPKTISGGRCEITTNTGDIIITVGQPAISGVE